MNKTLLSLLLIILTGCAPLPPRGEFTVEKLIMVPSLNREQIHAKSRFWIGRNLRSSKASIDYDNREEGIILANGTVDYPCVGFTPACPQGGLVSFAMREDIQDKKARLIFEHLVLTIPPQYNPATGWSSGTERGIEGDDETVAVKTLLLRLANEMERFLNRHTPEDIW